MLAMPLNFLLASCCTGDLMRNVSVKLCNETCCVVNIECLVSKCLL